MNEPVANARTEVSPQQEGISLDQIPAILWECAVSAFVKSILVLVFGNIVIGIAGGILGDMMPSAPPGVHSKPLAESTSSIPWASWRGAMSRHQFHLVFAVVFITTLWTRLTRPEGGGEESKNAPRLERMRRQLSENWFGLIVGNAFGAMISAMIVTWVQQFSPAKWLFGWLFGWVWAGLQDLVHSVFGTRSGDGLAVWLNWYGDNQMKFTFWVLYLATICDDLGIPNLKTLGRWLGRRLRKRMREQGQARTPNTQV